MVGVGGETCTHACTNFFQGCISASQNSVKQLPFCRSVQQSCSRI